MPLLLNHTIQGINQIRFSFRDKVQNYSFKKRSVISAPMTKQQIQGPSTGNAN